MTQKHTTFAKVAEVLKDLPVAKNISEVVSDAAQGNATILTAETGSGKTLLGSAKFADSVDDQVVVLVPRRYLAINAAETIANLGGLDLGKEVGFAVGEQAGDQSQFSKETKLLFVTYGYALSSGLIKTAKNIVADEVHEAGVDTSLARAVLHKRMESEPDLNVMEMSATVNAAKQAEYYADVRPTKTFHSEGKAFPCEFKHVKPNQELAKPGEENGNALQEDEIDKPTREIATMVADLIEGKYPLEHTKKKNREGIAIFRPGVKEVGTMVAAVEEECLKRGLNNVEVASIFGEMEVEEREGAVKAPAAGNVKVLIGTNVIESGVNIPWLDTGISDGTTKVPYYHSTFANNIEELRKTELPQWRIIQQEGRVKRFQDGVFILHSNIGMDERPEQQAAEITRVSPKAMLLHCANMGLDPKELKFDAQINKSHLLKAKSDLQRLDMLDSDGQLTDKGQFAVRLPVGPEAASVLYAAVGRQNPDIMPTAIEMSAIMSIKQLRADYKVGFGMSTKSETLDDLYAYQKIAHNSALENDVQRKDACQAIGMSWKGFKEVDWLVKELRARLGQPEITEERPKVQEHDLQVLMMHGHVNDIFKATGAGYQNLLEPKQEGSRRKGAPRQTVQVFELKKDSSHTGNDRFITADVRLTPRKEVLTDITHVSDRVMQDFLAECKSAVNAPKLTGNHRKNFLTLQYFDRSSIDFPIQRDKPTDAQQKILNKTSREIKSTAPIRRENSNKKGWVERVGQEQRRSHSRAH